jgi:predicted nicotinamide N-methyase
MTANVNRELSALLQRHLPFARAERQRLPGDPALELYLLNPDFPQHALSQEQMDAVLNYPAYWAFCWASGQVLASYLRDNPGLVAGKRCLDFGSGSGVAGIAAARLGAAEVVACDVDPDALAAAAANAVLNGVSLQLRENYEDCEGHFDLILVADVLYDRENLPWLDKFLERGDSVLVADSRIRDFRHPGYRRIGQWDSNTLPDLDESPEFRRVTIYAGDGYSMAVNRKQ